ncbi:hypothetical protein J6590_017655 [Homalodisca vitripennis]|nr:hypothetical protein J6590_017655 [Homalodisca vitripennis]
MTEVLPWQIYDFSRWNDMTTNASGAAHYRDDCHSGGRIQSLLLTDYAARWAREPVTGLTMPQGGHESLLLTDYAARWVRELVTGQTMP